MRHVEKDIMLKVLDQQWREHLGAMDYLRQGIHLRGYAQKDYRYEYKREAFELFAAMLERIKFDTVTILATLDVQVKSPEQIEREEEARRARLNRALQAQHAEAASLAQLGSAGEERPPQAPPPGPPRQARAARAADAAARSGRCAPRPRSDATSRARAAAARNSRTATACSRESSSLSSPSRGCAWWRRRCSTRGRVLIAERPAGKHMAGWWEFPGGKVADRTKATRRRWCASCAKSSASMREPDAEIMTLTHDYPDRVVDLVLWRATVPSGEPRGLDGQQLKWVDCDSLGGGAHAARRIARSSLHCSWYHRAATS